MTGSADLLPSQDLLSFQLFDWLQIDSTGLDRETQLSIFDVAQRLAVDAFLPHCRAADVNEPWLDAEGAHILPEISAAVTRFGELGLAGASFPQDVGGLGLPFTASLVVASFFASANPAAYAYPMLTIANARLISTFGSTEQIQAFAVPQIEGRWFGTMCLSEPQAGSSLGDIRTRAIPAGEDEFGQRYYLAGNKMWISGGDQDASENIVHLVLAKIPNSDGSLPEGSKGISLFIVPKVLPGGQRNDIIVAGLNHKLGFRGTTNCLLNFGEKAGATGWLVGLPGQGLAQMFMMMNEARITVGLCAAAIAYRGYRHALRYAAERLQGRQEGSRSGPPVPILAHADVRRMLLQQKVYAEGALALCFFCAQLVDNRTDVDSELLALLTPVAKSWPAEFGLMANDLSIQVHGGYGYTRDFDVEQLWRDNRLNPIHEGTTGIQAIDLLSRKILRSDGGALQLLLHRVRETSRRAATQPEWGDEASLLLTFWTSIADAVARLRQMPADDALDDATLFLRAFGHGVVAWLWLDQAIAAEAIADQRLRASIHHACHFFFDYELPQAAAWLTIVVRHKSLARSIPDEAFL